MRFRAGVVLALALLIGRLQQPEQMPEAGHL